MAEQEAAYSFSLEDPRWLAHLQDEGYCVVRGVASEEDVEACTTLLWRDIEAAHGAQRGNPETWAGHWPRATGLMAHLAQSAGAWAVRGLPKIHECFAQIWRTADLLVSMDSVIAWRPWHLDEAWRPQTEGLHIDQNPFLKPRLECVQGMVPLLAVTAASGGLEVVPRSHGDEAREVLRQHYKWAGDWCPLSSGCPLPTRPVLLLAKAGDLILWDSRTVHGGKVGTGEARRGDGEPTLARLSVAVAMTPREKASDEVQARRRAGFASGESFNHCPHEAGTSSGTIRRKLPRACARAQLSARQQALL